MVYQSAYEIFEPSCDPGSHLEALVCIPDGLPPHDWTGQVQHPDPVLSYFRSQALQSTGNCGWGICYAVYHHLRFRERGYCIPIQSVQGY